MSKPAKSVANDPKEPAKGDNTKAAHMANSGKSPSYALGDAQAERNKLNMIDKPNN